MNASESRLSIQIKCTKSSDTLMVTKNTPRFKPDKKNLLCRSLTSAPCADPTCFKATSTQNSSTCETNFRIVWIERGYPTSNSLCRSISGSLCQCPRVAPVQSIKCSSFVHETSMHSFVPSRHTIGYDRSK